MSSPTWSFLGEWVLEEVDMEDMVEEVEVVEPRIRTSFLSILPL